MQTEDEIQTEPETLQGCSCIARMNEALRETYSGVKLTTALGIHKPTIAVTRISGKGKVPVLFPNFCPFCGRKY